MEQGLAGKRVLVTGGTKGIGRASVLALARAGAGVVAAYRTPSEDAESLARELKELGARFRLVQADVTSPADVAALSAACSEELGGLDAIVNNVGIDAHIPFDKLPEPEWHRVIDHNVTSAYLVTQGALPLLADGGSIVNVGSSVALRGRPFSVHYTASKAALIGFTRALCKELGPRGIRVNLVSPGVTETEPGGSLPPQAVERIVAATALGRLGQPDDVAGAILFLIGDTSRYLTGITLPVDGGV